MRPFKDENELTKRTTKTKKFEKSIKMCNIKKYKTIRFKLTATDNIIHFNPQLQSYENVSVIFGYVKNKKGKNSKFKEKIEQKKYRSH